MAIDNGLNFYENLRRAVEGYVTAVRIANTKPGKPNPCPKCGSTEKVQVFGNQARCGIPGCDAEWNPKREPAADWLKGRDE
jgi:hypothetical protein